MFCKKGVPRNFELSVAAKDGGDILQGGCSFYIKNKLKSKILSDKKGL